MANENTQKQLDEALGKIEQLRKTRDDLARNGRPGVSDERIQGIVDLLTDIEFRSTALISRAKAETSALMAFRADEKDSSDDSELGSFIETLGKCAVNGVSTIVNGAVPITKSIVQTAGNLVNDVQQSAKDVAKTIEDAGVKTAEALKQGAVDASQALSGQTSNLENSLISTVTDTANGIFKAGTDAATGLVNSVLNPNGQSIIKNLTDNTASTVNSILGTANRAASGLLTSTKNSASGLLQQATSTVGNMVDSVSNFASGLIGGAAKSIINSVFPGKGGSGGDTSIGGLFGSAIQAGASSVGSAVKAATGIVNSLVGGNIGGVVGGLGGLASGLLGGAADVAGKMASAGLGAASNLLGAASDIGGSLLRGASNVAGSMLSTASNVAGGLLDGIGNIASSALGTAGDLVSGALGAAGDVAGAAANIAGDVLSSVGDVAGGLLDTASDMAQSVIDGVSDIAGSVIDTAADCVEGVVDAISDAFGGAEENATNMENEFGQQSLEKDWTKNPNENQSPEENWNGKEESQSAQGNNQGQAGSNGTGGQTGQGTQGIQSSQGSNDSSTTPMGNSDEQKDKGITPTGNTEKKFGWKSWKVTMEKGILAMMHDGDQQILNPYGANTSDWTMYSFRPSDIKAGFPQIAITPSSFEAIRSLDTMLDNVPWIVVKEYFFKNSASTMIDVIAKIMGTAQDAFKKANSKTKTDPQDKSSKGSGSLKGLGSSLLDAVKDVFQNVSLKQMAIDIPYILYAGLRAKQFGNTYIFPYLANDSTLINQSSNAAEWGNGDAEGGFMESLKAAANHAIGMVGGIATSLAGSQAAAAEVFPAPSWQGPGSNKDKIQFSFDLILINDNIVKARNNYMCVNTIIHNNRYIQKAILAFPGALYEIWLPTGQRHLMCTGDFKLYPLGLNRQTPKNFFRGGTGKTTGATFPIGSTGKFKIKLENPHEAGHEDGVEVIPDAYKLSIKFESCLANNMNTAVFQYYVKMKGYDHKRMEPKPEGWKSNEQDPGAAVDAPISGAMGKFMEKVFPTQPTNDIQAAEDAKAQQPAVPGTPQPGSGKSRRAIGGLEARDFTQEIVELVEKFDESTYNKQLGKLHASSGEKAINSDSVIETIRKTQAIIRESTKFLSRLYNAESNNLWYRPFEKEELYTTLKPDYRQILKKKYRELMDQVVDVSSEIEEVSRKVDSASRQLDGLLDMERRTALLVGKVDAERELNRLLKRRDELTDEVIQVDTDLVQAAFDEHDDVVSVKRNGIGVQIFKQVWNEKIMNSYERDKLQYLTSVEKKRYFQEKVRELKKRDPYGILNHADWYFRVVVLDYIVSEMQRLVYWFKNCSWDDFETIYRITRKLKLFHLDVDSIRSNSDFDINKTNLFYISSQDAKNFTKIDDLLSGNTLYELFQNQIRITVPTYDSEQKEVETSPDEELEKEVVRERATEVDSDRRRSVRQEIVEKYFGSESNLTKLAYDVANGKQTLPDGAVDYERISDLKARIMELKLKDRTEEEEDELADKIGAFTGYIRTIKEGLVLEQMSKMNDAASEQMDRKDGTVYAKVSH